MLPQELPVCGTGMLASPEGRDDLQEAGGVDEDEMFRVFNMGIGYVLAVRPAFVDSVVKQLVRDGETPHVIGRIERGQGRVRWTEGS